MSARARLAEPGERFITFGHPSPDFNGLTGRVTRYADPPTNFLDLMALKVVGITPPLVWVRTDRVLPGMPSPNAAGEHLTRHAWCWAIDGGEDLEDVDTRGELEHVG